MIAELLPEYCDVYGRRVFSPGQKQRRAGFRPSLPMGAYLTHPLKFHCKNLEELRSFLCHCRGSEYERRHKKDRYDHWQPPEEFEQTKKGDCVDFALWTWRQLVDMGFKARFTGGRAGKFGEGHAWVTFEKDGRFFLVEPQFAVLGLRLPEITAMRYHPSTSVGWDGQKVCYYSHEDRPVEPPMSKLPGLVGEWVFIYGGFLLRALYRIPLGLLSRLLRIAKTGVQSTPRPAAKTEADIRKP